MQKHKNPVYLRLAAENKGVQRKEG